MRIRHIVTALALVIVIPLCATTAHALSQSVPSTASLALFEGHYIDLRQSWGEATACSSDAITTVCFRTEAELDAYLDRSAAATANVSADGDFVILSTCSAPLKLYSGTSFSGTSLSLSTRGSFINLSTFGFDNVTSSYQVGACSSTFYDGASGGGSVYPGNTSAGASATSMLSGWDNRVSSVFIS
jgi:hypothetical protein